MSKTEKYLEIAFVGLLIALGIYYMWLAAGTAMLGEDEQEFYNLGKFFAQGEYPTSNAYACIYQFGSLIYAFIFFIFGASLGAAKAVSAFFGMLTLILLYAIGKRYSIHFGIFSTLLLFSMTLFSHSSMLAYQDVAIVFFSLLLMYMFARMSNLYQAFTVGALLSIAYYTKVVSIVLAIALLFYVAYQFFTKKNIAYIKLSFFALAVFGMFLTPLIARSFILYNFPGIEGLNLFFKNNPCQSWAWAGAASTEVVKAITMGQISLQFYVSTLGWLVLCLTIFGFALLITDKSERKNDIVILSAIFSVISILALNLILLTGQKGLEPRHFILIFPQLAIIGGYFLYRTNEWKKWAALIIIPILIFSVWTSISVAQSTHNSQRYPSDYVEAMKWIKDNTSSDARIFTTYTGSLGYYAEREGVWTADPCISNYFINLMTTKNSSAIYDALKDCNINYILIWRAIVAENYIIPQSNIWGVFTYSFVDTVSGDTQHFESVFSNQNNLVLKIK